MIRQRFLQNFPQIGTTAIMLAMILVTAFSLRIYNLDWDDGTFLHPDELHVVNTITLQIVVDWPPDLGNLLDPSFSSLNPRSIDPDTGRHHNFAYGALPLIVTDVAASTLSKITGSDWNGFYGHIHKVGRFLSALADTFTVLLVFLIARVIFSANAGLVGAALYATAPIPIQLSHFFTTDVWMTLFATLSIFCAVRAAQSGEGKWFALAGVSFGLAMASKASVVMLAIVILAAGLCALNERVQFGERPGSLFLGLMEQILLAILGFIVGFGTFEPYALLQPKVYLAQIDEQSRIVRGVLDVPFTRQYVGTTPILYQAEQLFRWGLGPVTALLFFVGIGYIVWFAITDRDAGAIVLSAWLVFEGALILVPETKFMRYVEPLLPILAVGAGGLLLHLLANLYRRFGHIGTTTAATAIFLGVALWSASFMSVYAAPNTRIQASEWMYQNIPGGSRISAETWDLALPISLAPGLNSSDRQIEQIQLELYRDREPATVADDIFEVVSSVDYIVMASNRVSTAIPQAPWRYPVQNRYYRLLENGELGFTLVARFERTPGIGSLRFNDHSADESFINYDHPQVLIYQKIQNVDRITYDALMAPATSKPYQPVRHAPEDTLMLDAPVGDGTVVADARWSSSITRSTFAALLVWILLLVILQGIGMPIASRLFPRFPDLGAGFGRLLTTLIAGYAVWILSSLQLIAFRAIWCWVAILLLASLSALLMRRERLLDSIRARFTAIAGAEIVFWSVFALFVIYRFINPDSWHPIWGGEKPMEFAHLNAILRSAFFPPVDPWFADGYINYYYYGTYLVAFWVKLTGIPSEIAFNLAQPTAIALIASTGYSVTAAISRGVSGKRSPWLGGAIGAVLLVLIGNLDSAVLVVNGFAGNIDPSFIEWTWGGSRAVAGGITEFPYFTGLYADLHAHVIAWPITILSIALSYSMVQQARQLASAISHGRSRNASRIAIGGRALVTMLTLGSLFATNAWDVPAFAALVVISIIMATSRLPVISLRIIVTLIGATSTAVGAFLLFQPFFSHYVTLFGSLDRTRGKTDIAQFSVHFGGFLTIIALGLVTISISGKRSSRFAGFADPSILAVYFGGLLIVDFLDLGDPTFVRAVMIVSVIAVLTATMLNSSASTGDDRWRTPRLLATGLGGIAATLFAIRGDLTVALAIAFAFAGAMLWFTGQTQAMKFTGALIAAGSAIGAGVEVVFLADDLAGDPVWYRMNTIFKFYNQIWTLFAVSAAVLLTMMVRLLRDSPEPKNTPEGAAVLEAQNFIGPVFDDHIEDAPVPHLLSQTIGVRWARAGVLTSAMLILAAFCFPLFSTLPRLEIRFPGHPGPETLNSLDWMNYGTLDRADGQGQITFDGDLAAINWFNDEIDGTPVIAEASIGPYRGNGSRISIATGLPTIIGWDRHERQQRYADELDTRWAKVRQLYDSNDPEVKMQILREFDVQYVVVGDVERHTVLSKTQYASAEGIAAFDSMVGTYLEIAFQFGATTIYRVLPATAVS